MHASCVEFIYNFRNMLHQHITKKYFDRLMKCNTSLQHFFKKDEKHLALACLTICLCALLFVYIL